MSSVHVLVPDGIDDPRRRSGGNVYDRRLCDGLRARHWSVHEHPVAGSWPRPTTVQRRRFADQVRELPERATVLIDGLIASGAPTELRTLAARCRVTALVHTPFGHPGAQLPGLRDDEARALTACAAIVATSGWTRTWILETYGLLPSRVTVCVPGTDPAPVTLGSSDGGRLVCIAALVPGKGQDTLLAALPRIPTSWTCQFVGPDDRDASFTTQLHALADHAGLRERVRFTGSLTGPELDQTYAVADLLVLPTRFEGYGMVLTEALARGIPVLASDVGGVTEAITGPDNLPLPGLLVPAGDPVALSEALARWLGDPALRRELRIRARNRRATLSTWSRTAAEVADVLTRVAG